jgi:hypothetical protein
MQTVELKFTKLDKLPIPESAQEILLVERADGMIRPIDIFDSMLTGKLAFNCHFSKELRYCHLKVTAATEPSFKVGDRVKWEHRKAEIIRILPNTKEALIEYSVQVSVMGFVEYNDHETRVPLKNLTLITE